MARDHDNHSNRDKALSHGFDDKPSNSKPRHEPTFSRYDEDEAYEEPDRDADYTSGFHANDVEDDDFDDYAEEDEPDLFQDEEADSGYEEDVPDEEDDYFEQQEERAQTWPLSLIAVAVVALILLAAGGYGVMQQRAATENELRELRAALATSGTGGEVSSNRDALAELQLAFDALAVEAEELRLENRALADTVAGLEAQSGNRQAVKVTADPEQTAPIAEPAAAPIPKPAQPVATPPQPPAPKAATPAVAASSGPWFVNFGSYATRNMAESWAARLQPGTGKVTIMPTTSNGRTLYRLRVIGLPDSDSAKRVARKLEADLRVSQLWIGKE